VVTIAFPNSMGNFFVAQQGSKWRPSNKRNQSFVLDHQNDCNNLAVADSDQRMTFGGRDSAQLQVGSDHGECKTYNFVAVAKYVSYFDPWFGDFYSNAAAEKSVGCQQAAKIIP
jgi:hypothetical protein